MKKRDNVHVRRQQQNTIFLNPINVWHFGFFFSFFLLLYFLYKYQNSCTFKMIISFFWHFQRTSATEIAIIEHFHTFNWFSFMSFRDTSSEFWRLNATIGHGIQTWLPRLWQECCGINCTEAFFFYLLLHWKNTFSIKTFDENRNKM